MLAVLLRLLGNNEFKSICTIAKDKQLVVMDITQQHEHDCFSDLVTLKWKLVWYHNKGVMNNNT